MFFGLEETEDTQEIVERILAALKTLRVSSVEDEYTLQEAIRDNLTVHNISFTKEHKIAPRNRLDFLVEGGVAIEVKRGPQKPNRTRLIQQISRYLTFDQVKAIIVVVDRNVDLPKMVNNKPCISFGLNKLWGIAL